MVFDVTAFTETRVKVCENELLLWKQEPKTSEYTGVSSSPRLQQVFLFNSIETQTKFISLENHPWLKTYGAVIEIETGASIDQTARSQACVKYFKYPIW